jgi:DNA sulfur modification protein DndD
MKIESLMLENFRSFYGTHHITFSIDPNRPVTIFIGENGSGKTTILNALYWIFTGKFTKQFSNPEELVNKDAVEEGVRFCTVELRFRIDKDNGIGHETYIVRRQSYHRNPESRLTITSIDADGVPGAPVKEQLVDSLLQKFLPKNLAKWFIFDGEAIDQIRLSGEKNFRDDLRKTFGFSEITTLLDALKSLSNDYRTQQAKSSGNAEAELLRAQIVAFEKTEEDCIKRLEELEERQAILDREEESCANQLRDLPHASAIESRRERADRSRRDLIQRRTNKERERNELLAKNAPRATMLSHLLRVEDALSARGKEQSLPYPFGERLLNDIEKMGQCICGTPVLPGSQEAASLAAHRCKANTGLLDLRVQTIRTALTQFIDGAQKYNERLSSLSSEISTNEREIAEQEAIISAADTELRGIPKDRISELQRTRDITKRELGDVQREIGIKGQQRDDARRSVALARQKEEQILAGEKRNQTVKKEWKYIENFMRYVDRRFKEQEAEVLESLGGELSRVLYSYLTKHFSAKVDPDNYSVTTYDIDGRPTGLSTGEGYVLKFALIAAIVGMAGGKTETSKVKWASDPIIAPLFFDAPFSPIDKQYRASIASNLGALAGQLALMFDSDKWDDELRAVLSSKVGKIYTIVSRAKGEAKLAQKTMTLNGEAILLNEYHSTRDDSICVERSVK